MPIYRYMLTKKDENTRMSVRAHLPAVESAVILRLVTIYRSILT